MVKDNTTHASPLSWSSSICNSCTSNAARYKKHKTCEKDNEPEEGQLVDRLLQAHVTFAFTGAGAGLEPFSFRLDGCGNIHNPTSGCKLIGDNMADSVNLRTRNILGCQDS